MDWAGKAMSIIKSRKSAHERSGSRADSIRSWFTLCNPMARALARNSIARVAAASPSLAETPVPASLARPASAA